MGVISTSEIGLAPGLRMVEPVESAGGLGHQTHLAIGADHVDCTVPSLSLFGTPTNLTSWGNEAKHHICRGFAIMYSK